MYSFLDENFDLLLKIFLACLAAAYAVYFGFAMRYEFNQNEASTRLFVMTIVFLAGVILYIGYRSFGKDIANGFKPVSAKDPARCRQQELLPQPPF